MRVEIVGVSGAVGQEFLHVLEGRDFPVDSLRLFGSKRSAGRKYTFRGQEYAVEELVDNDAFKDIDIAFVSAGAGVSRTFEKTITRYGAVMIDNSSAFRMDADVPLVIPEVNGEDALKRPRNVISNPNCTTIVMLMAVAPIHHVSAVRNIHLSTYQAASGAGASAMQELIEQHSQICMGKDIKVEKFSAQLAFNLIPHIDIFEEGDYTKEEMKTLRETRKILHDDRINVSTTCVRVPVLRAHSEAIWLDLERPVSPDEARDLLKDAPGVVLMDNPSEKSYPMPLDIAGKDDVYVGRLRCDLCNPNGLLMWVVGDQIKKGAALNAVQIAEWLIKNDPRLKH